MPYFNRWDVCAAWNLYLQGSYAGMGDASYDTDHRGFWGASQISRDDDFSNLLLVADEMIEEAREHAQEP